MWTLWRQNQKVDDVGLGQMDDVEAESECGRGGGRVRRWTMWSWVRWTMWRLGQNVDNVKLGKKVDDVELGQKVDDVEHSPTVEAVEGGSQDGAQAGLLGLLPAVLHLLLLGLNGRHHRHVLQLLRQFVGSLALLVTRQAGNGMGMEKRTRQANSRGRNRNQDTRTRQTNNKRQNRNQDT